MTHDFGLGKFMILIYLLQALNKIIRDTKALIQSSLKPCYIHVFPLKLNRFGFFGFKCLYIIYMSYDMVSTSF